ncbi:hypothetical protein [Leptospira meyeri]|uniref:hypothetical protein n=1 Tax=Leptospira meyeri TaxID=29508 RepID=UPI0014383019|nr:hypothetical protein [Leptospira meyeri]MCW7488562.1 hypothetical protein [Leptospira meyeri]
MPKRIEKILNRLQLVHLTKGNFKMYFVEGLLPELQREGHPKIPNQEFAKRYSALSAIS